MPVSEVRNDLILFIKSLSNNSKINYIFDQRVIKIEGGFQSEN